MLGISDIIICYSALPYLTAPPYNTVRHYKIAEVISHVEYIFVVFLIKCSCVFQVSAWIKSNLKNTKASVSRCFSLFSNTCYLFLLFIVFKVILHFYLRVGERIQFKLVTLVLSKGFQFVPISRRKYTAY